MSFDLKKTMLVILIGIGLNVAYKYWPEKKEDEGEEVTLGRKGSLRRM